MSNLADHAMRRRFNGFPIFDDEGELIERVNEPLWKFSDLTSEQKEEFGAVYFKMGDEAPKDPYWTDAKIYAACLEEFGIACWHPPVFAKFRASKSGWGGVSECLVCDSYLVALPSPKGGEHGA